MRLFLLILLAAMSTAAGQSFVVEKPAFRNLVPADAAVEKLAGGFQFIEGPAWNSSADLLIFSDIPADKICFCDPRDGTTGVFRAPSQHANGNFFVPGDDGLYTCEHGSRTVTVECGKAVATLVSEYEGGRFNSPNDLVVKSDGTVWFTDPTYGLEGRKKEQATNNVYCFHPKSRALLAVATDFVQPNGLCFSPDEKLLYVADSDRPRHIRVFDVTADNRLSNGRVFCQIDKGVPDGIRCDRHGNVWSSAGDGVQIFAPDGTRLGKILVPETPANLCFGGRGGDELFITARTSLYRVKVTANASGHVGASPTR